MILKYIHIGSSDNGYDVPFYTQMLTPKPQNTWAAKMKNMSPTFRITEKSFSGLAFGPPANIFLGNFWTDHFGNWTGHFGKVHAFQNWDIFYAVDEYLTQDLKFESRLARMMWKKCTIVTKLTFVTCIHNCDTESWLFFSILRLGFLLELDLGLVRICKMSQ